jgi:hypothetical protein
MPNANWTSDDPPHMAIVTVRQVINDGQSILLVVRDAEGGGWQLLTGGAFKVAAGMVVSLQSILARDPTLADVADLRLGWRAVRKQVGGPW